MSPTETRMASSLRLVAAGFGALALLLLAGVPLAGPGFSTLFCLALLLIGLPHGALDIERLKSARRTGWNDTLGLFAIYLVLAGVTYASWHFAPVLAMTLFLACAVLHFGEDWLAMDDPLLALGTAAALLAAPALLHKGELRAIFAVVTGEAEGALLAEIMRTLAPVAIGLAMVGMLGLVRSGRLRQAACCALLLAGMIIAPPLAAFALFFCCYHSPLHLHEAWTSLTTSRAGRLLVAGGLTAASVGIAVLLSWTEWRGSLPPSLVAATFMTFSVLTVPHMLSPLIVGLLRRRPEHATA